MYLKEKIALTVAGILFVLILAYAGFGHHLWASGLPPRTLVLDGNAVATVKAFTYHPDDQVFEIETDQELYGCREGVIFSDRFEDD